MSINSYKSAISATENPRQTEYRLFALVTKALMDAKEAGGKGKKFIAAVDWNRRMWLTLQMDLASDQNGLTDELRAQLISVAIWVDKHSSVCLRGDASIDPLISVNRTIMEGLAQQPKAQEAQPAARPAFAAGGTSA
jgi:flagellar biosynthesis activator protein FlaF